RRSSLHPVRRRPEPSAAPRTGPGKLRSREGYATVCGRYRQTSSVCRFPFLIQARKGHTAPGKGQMGRAYTPACRMPQALLGRIFDRLAAASSSAGDRPRNGSKGPSPIMTEDEVLAEFRASHALLEGHFVLSSGRHSAFYLQCARVLMDPERAGRLALALAQKLPRELRGQIEKVVSPAMGGIIIGHEMGRALGVEAIFVERPTGTFELRRGFTIGEGEKVLL